MNIRVFLLAWMLGLGVAAGASSSDEFSYNPHEVEAPLAVLEEADAYLAIHDASEAELRAHGALPQSIVLHPWNPEDDGPPFGIPSFLWGCCFGLLGVLFVYLMTDNNKEEAQKALIGCVVGGLASTLFYVAYVLLVVSTVQ